MEGALSTAGLKFNEAFATWIGPYPGLVAVSVFFDLQTYPVVSVPRSTMSLPLHAVAVRNELE